MIVAFLLHAFFSTWIAYVLALAFGELSTWISALSLGLGTFFGFRLARRLTLGNTEFQFRSFSNGQPGALEKLLTGLVLYVCGRHFIWIFFQMDHNLATLSVFNYGDLPLHINYIRSLAAGLEFPLSNPSFAMESLRYPLGVDLYNALWESLGVPLAAHLALTGIAASIASVVLLRSFAGWWGIGGFFLSGGLVGWSILKGQPLDNFHASVEWKNLLLTVFITQRGFLFALPLGLLLLKCFRDHFSGRRPLSRHVYLGLMLVWGGLPLIHLHAFVVLSVLIAASAFEEKRMAGLKELFRPRLFFWAFAPALGLILYSTSFFSKAGVAHWDWFWTAPEGQALEFFVFNFGFWLILPLAIGIGLWRARKSMEDSRLRKLWIEFAVYLSLLLLFLNLMLAPWAWDNVKVLIWPYLGLARLGWIVVDPLLNSALRPITSVALFYSGFLALVWSVQAPPAKRAVTLYSTAELAKVEGALSEIPMSAVFAAAPTHHHPLTYFGRLRILGYEGHLWSHGIDSAKIDFVRTRQENLMKGLGDWKVLVEELGITHIFWGPLEQTQYGDGGERPWMNILRNVSRVPGYAIYAVDRASSLDNAKD